MTARVTGEGGADPVTAAEFAELMARLGPFGEAPRIAVAVSGGPHSLALALLAEGWARACGGDALALIVDHGLRPESSAEAGFVRDLLAGQGIAAQILPLGLPPGAGLQDRARTGRFDALAATCAATGRPWLLLGHHRADQAETLLFRALRGSGAAGLAAMAPARSVAGALVLRPLLDIPPVRLEAVVSAAGLRPVRDPSNDDPRFARVRLRGALADPGDEGRAVAALAAAAGAFAGRRARQAAAVAARLAEAVRLWPEGWAEIDPVGLGGDRVAIASLRLLIQAVGGARFPAPASGVAALLARGCGTSGGTSLGPAPRGWRLVREAAAVAAPVAARSGAYWDGRFRLTGPGDPGATLGALGPVGAAALRACAPRVPAAVLATLPTIRRKATLAAVPALDYPDPESCARFALVFAPAVAGSADWRGSAGHSQQRSSTPHGAYG